MENELFLTRKAFHGGGEEIFLFKGEYAEAAALNYFENEPLPRIDDSIVLYKGEDMGEGLIKFKEILVRENM